MFFCLQLEFKIDKNMFCCLACDVLPMLLRGTVQLTTQAQFFVWLEKVIEFFVCYVSQSVPEEAGLLCKNLYQLSVL